MLRALALTAFAVGSFSVAIGPVLGDTGGALEAASEGREQASSAQIVAAAHATTPAAVEGPVYLVSIDGEVELGLASYVQRAIEAAEEAGAGAVVVQIDTPGGRVDAALDIRDLLLDTDVPTIAIVNRRAFSAGALIALAAERIYMVPGSSIGAAAPVTQDGEMAGEKMVSALSKAFAATAERRGRSPLMAKAMVDESVSIKGLIEPGKLLSLSHDEALHHRLADGSVDSLDDLLGAMTSREESVVEKSPTPAERIVRFLTNPFVASLLISLGFLGLFFELQTPGFGIGGSIALAALGLYFWGHHLAGLAGMESVILISVGVALMAVEVFLLPGFGVFGVIGLLSFLGGLFLSRMSEWALPGEVMKALHVTSGSLLLMLAGAWALLAYFPKNRFFSKVVLFSAIDGKDEHDDDLGPPWGKSKARSYRGYRGVAMTDLRPSGTIKIDGQPVDVVTEGSYIQAGTTVEVIEDSGSRRVVRAVESSSSEEA